MASADIGNYGNRRFEGMINLPIVDDRVDLRIAGEWTKRQGYSFNELTDSRIDGRDLWSGRVSLWLEAVRECANDLVWEHFSEDDDRMRTAKQLCKTAPFRTVEAYRPARRRYGCVLSGNLCQPRMSPDFALFARRFRGAERICAAILRQALGDMPAMPISSDLDPYASTVQSRNLRVIEILSQSDLQSEKRHGGVQCRLSVTPTLTFTSQTGYNHDFLWSTEDYNRFNSAPGIFAVVPSESDIFAVQSASLPDPAAGTNGIPMDAAVFCDPQLGCSDRLVAQDLSDEHAWQLSQEFRLASNFSGPLNFSVGGNYLHYETEENYYVFINTLSMLLATRHNNEYTTYVPWSRRIG